jgi:hypothetical protein
MDTKIRELQKDLSTDPDNNLKKQALVRAWRRAGYEPESAHDLALVQEDWVIRDEELRAELSKEGGKRFNQFLAALFKENSNLDQFLYEAYTPRFMDGSPIHGDYSVMVNPKWWCHHGILSYEEVYENTDGMNFHELEKSNELVIKPGIFNSKLSKEECSKLEDLIFAFGKVMKRRWGTNCRVLVKRDLNIQESHKQWYPENVIWEREEYDAEY